MSELKTNKVSPATGTALQLGDSGDTVSVPSGATLSVSGSLTLPDDSVTTAKILDSNVTTAKIADNNVTTAKIADNNVTTAKIADNNVTLAKLDDGTQGDILYYAASGAPTRLGFGTSGDFLKTQGTGANPAWATITGGLSYANVWRMTSAFTVTADTESPIVANLEEDDTSGTARIGAAMTESSGIFTFPATGIWRITSTFKSFGVISGMTYIAMYIYTTINDGTAWVFRATQSSACDSTHRWGSGVSTALLDVTDTTQCKVAFRAFSPNANTLSGDSGYNQTTFEFYKLGDT